MAISLAGAYLLGSLGAGTMSSASSYLSSQQAWKKQKKMFAWQKAWEKEKMQNSYQWAVDDMQKAGLNPALGYTQGGATGSGAPNPSTPTAPNYNPTEAISSAINLINSTKLNDSQIDLNDSNTGKAKAEEAGQILNNQLVEKYGDKKILSEIANNLAKTGEAQSQSAKNIAEKEKTDQETKSIKEGIGTKVFGTDANTSSTLLNLAAIVGGGLGAKGIIGGAKGIKKAYDLYKTSKGFNKFLSFSK